VKEIDELNLPDNAHYTEDHEYALSEGSDDGTIRIGLSDYAQDQLGDIVFVELPQEGDHFGKGEEFGVIESVKAVAELYMPVSGEILAVNATLEDSPELVNASPYDDGWMMRVKPANPEELETLMTRDAYRKMLKGIE